MPVKELFSGLFTAEQTRQLLQPINGRRVKEANGHNHVPAYEVIAHLNRIFGFGNWSYETLHEELVFETVRPESQVGTYKVNGQDKPLADAPHKWRYDACYRASVRLTIFDKEHRLVTWYDDSSTGDAQNLTRADAHDLALKSAISLAKKRAAVHLGDQFGLSLYNKGSMLAIILKTLVAPKELLEEWKSPADSTTRADDLQAGVPQAEGMGIDEIEKDASSPEHDEAINRSLGGQPK